MNRRQFLSTIPAAAAALPALAAGAKKPNVLFLAIDDMNGWLGCLGGHPDVKTPNIDRLASRGTLFTNAHCQAPICGPSRASIMTGLLPSTTGIYGQINDGQIRQASPATKTAPFLFEYFRDHGYKTMAMGKLFHQHVPKGTVDESGGRVPGFGPTPAKRFKWDAEKTSTDWGAFPDRDEEMPDYGTAQWSIERLRQKHDKPFLLAAGFLRPHVPWYVPKKWFDMYPADRIAMPPYLPNDFDDIPEIGRELAEVPMMPTTEWAKANGEWKYIVQAYLACVTFVDHYVGEILRACEASEYAGNTHVVLWGDHGYHIGEKNRFAKHSLWEEATRAPLLIAGPGFEGGQVCRKPVGMIDMYPTLLELCGLPANDLNEGHSLRPLLENPGAEWPHAAITTYGRNNHAVRTEHFRYVRYEDGSEELYDHREDANEWRNLAGNPKFASLKERLKKHLPAVNVAWSPVAPYDFNEYLDKAYKRQVAR